jgi:Holliday junction resolvase RusA-like endonuclease
LAFRVDGEPVAQPRHRIAARGRYAKAYIPRDHAIHGWKWAIEEAAREQAERGGWVPVKGEPLAVVMRFYFKQPKSNRSRHHVQRPDLDNLAKAVLDALHGIAFLDDACVVGLRLQKEWASQSGLEVEVRN